ncbi:molecular chaperone Tir [Bifidobacterium pseudolongum subsp. globosum]|uniref:TIR domain-containing protein n=1 Tax=Bifidobacterium pseudolongum TaxID=1694 RepID=UPI0010200077|nr:molecular chaperone Tir [Bifidobacterium pseudolongum subsp. globosum]
MSVFYSFHYARDNWRVQQIMNIGQVERNPLLSHQEWEQIKRGGDQSIRNWIDGQMRYKSAVIVLTGYETANREWVRYEIQRAYDLGKPLLGVRINRLKDRDGNQDPDGPNPFRFLGIPYMFIPLYEPSSRNSQDVYREIRANLPYWSKQGYSRH